MKRVDLGFTELEIYDDFAVGRTRTGVDIDLEKHEQVMDVLRREIPGRFGIIVDEVNSYSVRFEVLRAMRKDPRIACAAAVVYRFATIKAMAVAAMVAGTPSKTFSTLDEAKDWVRDQLSRG